MKRHETFQAFEERRPARSHPGQDLANGDALFLTGLLQESAGLWGFANLNFASENNSKMKKKTKTSPVR
jgi:hypothetical protein